MSLEMGIQTKPIKSNLSNQTYETKPMEPNLPNQTYQNRSCQGLTKQANKDRIRTCPELGTTQPHLVVAISMVSFSLSKNFQHKIFLDRFQ